MIAAPRFVRRNPVKCDPRVIKVTQHNHRLCFVRAVANIDAGSVRFRTLHGESSTGLAIDQRRDQRTQRRHHPVERSRETDPLPPRPRQPCRFMPLPFSRHPVTQLGRSSFTHPATVEAAVSAAKFPVGAAVSAAQQSSFAGDTRLPLQNLRPTRPPPPPRPCPPIQNIGWKPTPDGVDSPPILNGKTG